MAILTAKQVTEAYLYNGTTPANKVDRVDQPQVPSSLQASKF